MLAALTSFLWIATIWFINPATNNTEFSRIIPIDSYHNNSETCGNNLKTLMDGADKLGMQLTSGDCTRVVPDELLKSHGVVGRKN